METPFRFSVIVKQARKSRGWTLDIVARKAATTRSYLSSIENEMVAPPSEGLVRRLSKLFKLDVTDMMRLAWQPKVPKEIRHLLEVKDGSKDQPVTDTPISTEAATAVFKEAFTEYHVPPTPIHPITTYPQQGAVAVPDESLSVRPVEGGGA